MGGGAFVFFSLRCGVTSLRPPPPPPKVAVKAAFDGVPYAGSLMTCGGPHHMLGVLKAIREKTGKGVGDVVEVEVWRDVAERTVEVPAKFLELMKREGLLPFFEGLSYRAYASQASTAGGLRRRRRKMTQLRRLAKAVEMPRKVRTPGYLASFFFFFFFPEVCGEANVGEASSGRDCVAEQKRPAENR